MPLLATAVRRRACLGAPAQPQATLYEAIPSAHWQVSRCFLTGLNWVINQQQGQQKAARTFHCLSLSLISTTFSFLKACDVIIPLCWKRSGLGIDSVIKVPHAVGSAANRKITGPPAAGAAISAPSHLSWLLSVLPVPPDSTPAHKHETLQTLNSTKWGPSSCLNL